MNVMKNGKAAGLGRAGHLVRVVTGQGMELSGFHAMAGEDAPLLLCLHGLSGGLDTSFVFDFLSTPSLGDCHLLTITCSGHGNIAMARAGDPPAYRLGGSAFEYFDDCVPDLAAWVDYARAHTRGPIVLLGHSLGASKVAHYAGQTQDERVHGVVLASAPDLKGAFIALHGAERVQAYLEQARAMVAQGRGASLMDESCVIGLLRQRVSAQTLVDRFGEGKPADTFDFYHRNSAAAFQALGRISAPVLAIYGHQGEIVGPGGTGEAIALLRRHAARAAAFDSLVVPGNHWYMGAERQAAEGIAQWMATRCMAATVQEDANEARH